MSADVGVSVVDCVGVSVVDCRHVSVVGEKGHHTIPTPLHRFTAKQTKHQETMEEKDTRSAYEVYTASFDDKLW